MHSSSDGCTSSPPPHSGSAWRRFSSRLWFWPSYCQSTEGDGSTPAFQAILAAILAIHVLVLGVWDTSELRTSWIVIGAVCEMLILSSILTRLGFE